MLARVLDSEAAFDLTTPQPSIRMIGNPGSQQYLMSLLTLPDEQVPPLAKAGLVYGASMAAARQAISAVISEETLASLQEVVGATVDYMASRRTAFPALLAVMCHDFSLYTHSVNVAVYAIALAIHAGITDYEDLQNLALGAMLHDLGKAKMPKDLLNKRGALTADEWSVLRKHPSIGAEMLAATADVPEITVTVILQHHERLDGSGYPEGIFGEKLHRFSMVVSIVDAYDAMTSHRPYRLARTPYNALLALKRDISSSLDPTLFAHMVRLLGDSSYHTAQ